MIYVKHHTLTATFGNFKLFVMSTNFYVTTSSVRLSQNVVSHSIMSSTFHNASCLMDLILNT